MRHIGIDKTCVKKGQNYITVVHDLLAKLLLFAMPGRDHQTELDFAKDLKPIDSCFYACSIFNLHNSF